jgi:hypothetical protein
MKALKWLIIVSISFIAVLAVLSIRPAPEKIEYGVTFTKYFADELGVDWIDVYQALLDDLKVRKLRLAAHWPMIEPERDMYDFSDLDYQISEASKRDASIILAIGRRLPRWPECHTPHWVGYMGWDEQKMEIRQYLTAIVTRYKDEPHIKLWQVENEPYLSAFAGYICGPLDEGFLKEEVALVKSLDPDTPVLLTDSGNERFHERHFFLEESFVERSANIPCKCGKVRFVLDLPKLDMRFVLVARDDCREILPDFHFLLVPPHVPDPVRRVAFRPARQAPPDCENDGRITFRRFADLVIEIGKIVHVAFGLDHRPVRSEAKLADFQIIEERLIDIDPIDAELIGKIFRKGDAVLDFFRRRTNGKHRKYGDEGNTDND